MSHLDHLLDDALLGFDEDDKQTPFRPSQPQASQPAEAASSRAATDGTAARASSHGASPQQAAYQSSAQQQQQSATAVGSSSSSPPQQAGTGISNQAAQMYSGKMQFDPLKRKQKGKAGDSGGSSSSRPALTPQVHKLQEDLAKLVAEWSQALHPEADADLLGSEAPAAQQRGKSSVLQALAQQTQRTVEQQARMRPPPAHSAPDVAGGAAGAAGAGGDQMNMIVDVVMQHLLSKEVLYQPMKEIMEKYPPWLNQQAAGRHSSQVSAEDLDRYRQQYACITRVCEAFETEPDNTAKIMALLQEMQACGEPPADIVKEVSSAIAADLPVDAANSADIGLGDLNFDNLNLGDLTADLPQDLKNCPVQ
eukprot:GHRR01001334.1.p1 GENE.GHRR01001334.1~~GHRR01001334.1.p1  ORF type:complete len:365 (+),score=176.34 GHRR01001334.1:151-1245(+)